MQSASAASASISAALGVHKSRTSVQTEKAEERTSKSKPSLHLNEKMTNVARLLHSGPRVLGLPLFREEKDGQTPSLASAALKKWYGSEDGQAWLVERRALLS